MRKLKLIWDFRGPVAKQTAQHHVVHLNEYIKHNQLGIKKTGIETITDMHSLAYMVVDELQMPKIRDDLKPHRGQLYQP